MESFVILIGAIVLLIWIISRLLGRSSSNNVSPSLSFRPSDRKQPTQSVPHPSLTNSPLSFDAAFDEAVTKKKRLWIEYRDLNADISQRNIEVYFPKDKTYVFAWCCLRNQPRTFRRDAILRWKVLDGPLNGQKKKVHTYLIANGMRSDGDFATLHCRR